MRVRERLALRIAPWLTSSIEHRAETLANQTHHVDGIRLRHELYERIDALNLENVGLKSRAALYKRQRDDLQDRLDATLSYVERIASRDPDSAVVGVEVQQLVTTPASRRVLA